MHRVYNTLCTSMMREEPLSLALVLSFNENTVFSLRFVHRTCTSAHTHFPFSPVCASFLLTLLYWFRWRDGRVIVVVMVRLVLATNIHSKSMRRTSDLTRTEHTFDRAWTLKLNGMTQWDTCISRAYLPLCTAGKKKLYVCARSPSLALALSVCLSVLYVTYCGSRCVFLGTTIECRHQLNGHSVCGHSVWNDRRYGFERLLFLFRVLTRRVRTWDANKFRCDFDSIRRAVNENQGLSSINMNFC